MLKTVSSTFQDVDGSSYITTLYQLMLQSWYQKLPNHWWTRWYWQNGSWTIENANRLVYTCFVMMQFFFTEVQKISVQSALGLHSLFCRMQSEGKPVQRKPQNVEKDERSQEREQKWRSLVFVSGGHKIEAQSPWKKLKEAANLQSLQKMSISRSCKRHQDAFSPSPRSQLLQSQGS